MTRVIITGAKGRMGQALISCAKNFHALQVVAQIDCGDDLSAAIAQGDVVVDFSLHTATAEIAGLCARHKKAIVIGTTGHSESEQSVIRNLKSVIPMVWSSNYSTGVSAAWTRWHCR
jgi:4-hydroxy-tetrahydrodipicolinate reductase